MTTSQTSLGFDMLSFKMPHHYMFEYLSENFGL